MHRGGRTTAGFALGVAALALLAAPSVRAQLPGSRMNADKLIDRVVDGRPVMCLFGNAFIDRDSVTAAADTAYIQRDTEIYDLQGNVRLTRGNSVLTCRRAHYDQRADAGDFAGDVRITEDGITATGAAGSSNGAGRWMSLRGNALLVAPEYTVRGDTITQDRQTETGEAFGHVRIVEPGSTNLVTGGHAFFDRRADAAVVDRSPELTSRDKRGGLLVAESRLMRLFRAEDRVVMVDSVRIRQALGVARADTAVSYGHERLVLTGSPRVKLNRGTVLVGERIEFEYTGDQLRRIILTGTARTTDDSPDSLANLYAGLPREDMLEGDVITIDFEDEEIRRTEVIGNARSVYTPLDVGTEVVTNDVSGDTILVYFREQEVRRVRVLGKAAGKYRFAQVSAWAPRGGSATGDSLVAAADSAVSGGASAVATALGDTAAAPLPAAAAGDSTVAVTPRANGPSFESEAELVDYGGDRVTFELRERSMAIDGHGRLDYGKTKLKARQVRLAMNTRELYAAGEPIAEDDDKVTGQRMGYNFRNRTAVVDSGVTSFDDYYYVGEGIRRFGDQTMKIEGGRMTSCDLDEPHYHFWSRRMKMKPGDKVVAAPIVLKIGNVPIFALPFYFKNLQEGRRSGVLFPTFDFGWSSREGRYIRDLGYYFALSDYLDFLIQGDYNENSDVALRSSTRYVKRYGWTGGLDWSRRDGLDQDKSRQWQLSWYHNQPALLDDYQFRADVRLASNTLSRNDLAGAGSRDIVSGQFKSSAYISRNWSLVSASLNAGRDGRVNATDTLNTTDNQIYTLTLPSLSFNFRQLALKPALPAGRQGNALGDLLRATYFQQGYTFKQDRRGYEEHDVRTTGASGNWSLRVQPPRLGIFNFGVNATARQSWQRESSSGRSWLADGAGGGDWQVLSGLKETTSPAVSFGASLGTTLYGLFPAEVGRLRAIRHTVRMASSWNVSPALGDKQPYSTSLSLSLDQRFDVKYRPGGADTTATDKKLDGVLDWTLNTSYNPRRPAGQRWSDISSGLTIKPGQSRYLQLKVSNTIDARKLALRDTRFSYGVNFSGRLDLGKVEAVAERKRNAAIERLGLPPAGADSTSAALKNEGTAPGGRDLNGPNGVFSGSDADFAAEAADDAAGRAGGQGARDLTEGGRYLPFQTSGSLSYSYLNATGDRRASASVSLRANLSRYWEFNYQTSFDLVTGAALRQQYTLGRDLHCWRLEFNRTVSAVDSQFGFRVYLKAIPSLKFTRGREDYMGSLGDGVGGGYF
jgi:lipopolysaccharide assembly outer membrane protein LptD (OstA)